MKKTLSLLAFLICCNIGFSNDGKPISDLDHLVDSLKTIMEEDKIAGAMLGIIREDSVIFSGGFGLADIERSRPVDEKTLFRMGSVTKPVIALGIMKLVEQGLLNLEDELKTVAPDVPFKNKWEKTHPVKIVHLLEHTTGFDDVKVNRFCTLDQLDLSGKEKMLAQKSSLVSRWKPGERLSYSNPNYAVLGYVIEKVSGLPFEDFIKKEIFDPLGMTDTNFDPVNDKPDQNTLEYKLKNGEFEKVPSVILWSISDGGLWSSASDMLKLLQMFLNDGAPLFRAETIERMEFPASSLASRAGLKHGYGLGNTISYITAKHPFSGHDGYVGTCHSGFYYIRSLDMGFVISSNREFNFSLRNLVAHYLVDSLEAQKPEAIPLDHKAIEPFLGRYQFDSPRNQISAFREKFLDAPFISIKDDKLIYDPFIGPPSELIQTGPLTFAWVDNNVSRLIFTKTEDGKKAMSITGAYYEKRSNLGTMLQRGIMVLAAAVVIIAIPLALLFILLSLLGKMKWRKTLQAVVPAIALLCLVICVLKLWVVQFDNPKLAQLSNINPTTLTIFFGSSVFGLGTIALIIIALKNLYSNQKGWFKYYYLLTAVSFAIVFTILWQHGWIGMRTWSM